MGDTKCINCGEIHHKFELCPKCGTDYITGRIPPEKIKIEVTGEWLIDQIEYLGYCVRDVDLSLNDADDEIKDILQGMWKEFTNLAAELGIDWRTELEHRKCLAEED